MKKQLIIALLALMPLSPDFPVIETSAATVVQTSKNVSTDWIKIGWVHCRSSMGKNNVQGELYVMVVSDKTFYKVNIKGWDYAVVLNPDYKNSGSWSKDYTHKAADGWYLNVNEF